MHTKSYISWLVLLIGVLGGSAVYAEGIVQKASKDVAKGAIKGAQQELNSEELIQGAKQVTKAMVDGAANAAPLVTSQVVKQTDINRKTVGKIARQVSSDAVVGAVGATVHEVDAALGKNAEGPLADTMTATSERVTAGIVRGVVSELHIDGTTTEKIAAAAVRGAVSEMHFNVPVWSFLLAFVAGSVATLLCGVGLLLLYILFQRRRGPILVTNPGALNTRPVHGIV